MCNDLFEAVNFRTITDMDMDMDMSNITENDQNRWKPNKCT